MEVATALHHSAQRPKSRVVEEPSEGEVRETYNAPRRLKAPLPGMRPVLPPEPEPLERAVTDGYVAAPAPLLVVASLAGDVVDATTVSYLLKEEEEDSSNLFTCSWLLSWFRCFPRCVPVDRRQA